MLSFLKRYSVTILVGAAVVGLNGYGAYRLYQLSRPERPFEDAVTAIHRNDALDFSKAVDVERLVASYYDQHLGQGTSDDGERERVTRALARRLRYWIDTGEMDRTYPRFDALAQFLREAAAPGRHSVRKMETGQAVGFESVELTNAEKQAVRLDLKLVKEHGHWRIAELLNVNQVIGILKELETRRMAAMIAPVRRQVEIMPPVPVRFVGDPAQRAVYRGEVRAIGTERVDRVECRIRRGGKEVVRTLLANPAQPGTSSSFEFIWDLCDPADAGCQPVLSYSRVVLNGRLITIEEQPLD